MEELRAIDARPIKKVAEAKARKRKRMLVRAVPPLHALRPCRHYGHSVALPPHAHAALLGTGGQLAGTAMHENWPTCQGR